MKNNKAFTLVELLLVIAIVAIIATFSTAFYSRLITQNSIVNIQDQIISQARKAQTYAMNNKKDSAWGIYYASNVLTLYSGNNYASRNAALDEKFTFSSNITITGLTDINFTKVTGKPNTTANVTISGTTGTRSVTINSQGNISP